jgi:hypothetical protein
MLLVISLDHWEIFNVFHSTHIGAVNNNAFSKFVIKPEAASQEEFTVIGSKILSLCHTLVQPLTRSTRLYRGD